jgi:hypothetical protein
LVLAWILCAAGIALGGLGCCYLVTNPRPDDAADTTAVTASAPVHEPEVWVGLVGAAAHDALSTLRRLASRTQPVDAGALHDELRDAAARFRYLRDHQPPRLAERVEVARLLDIAATGADVEAARLAGGTVVRNDRRAFLDAVRALSDLPARADTTVAMRSAPAASGDLAPTFTVA